MPWRARPTLRCLSEYLTDGWDDHEHFRVTRSPSEDAPLPSLSDLAHPVIQHAATLFSGDDSSDVARESISGLTDPPFWKLKTGRWRGAVWLDKQGQAWIVAAGLRRENESDDFYKSFMATVASSGAEPFLPTAADLRRLKIESVSEALADWERQLHTDTVNAAVAAGAGDPQQMPVFSLDRSTTAANVEITIEVVKGDPPEEDIAELTVVVEPINRSMKSLIERAEIVILSAISPQEQDWSQGYTAAARIYSMTESSAVLRAGIQASAGRRPGLVIAGTTAHYTHRNGLTDCTIEGKAVKALCGAHFVPRQDFDSMPVCPLCAQIYKMFDTSGV